jgi:hypothetical protein
MTNPRDAPETTVSAVQFFTRPGCGVSMLLSARLRRLDVPVEYHDIWADGDSAAFVRSVARGNETVPTVVIGPAVLVAPSRRQVLATVARHAPELLPLSRRKRWSLGARWRRRRSSS